MRLMSTLRNMKGRCLDLLLRHALRGQVSGRAALRLHRWLTRGRRDVRVLPVVWLDRLAKKENALLRSGGEGTSFAPHFVGLSQLSGKVRLPDIHYFVFRNARVSAASSSVIVEDEKIIIERAAVPDPEIHSYAGGHICFHDDHHAVIQAFDTSTLKRGIFLGGNGSWNYYHWIVELLTKLEFVAQLPERLQAFPLLVSEEVVSTPSLKAILEICAKCHRHSPEVIALKKDRFYVVDELIYINSANSLPFNLTGDVDFKYTYSSLDGRSIAYLRDAASQSVADLSDQEGGGRRIFFARKEGRRNFNQDEVFYFLEEYGFSKVFMEDLEFSEQVRIMNQAEFIVGPTGAAWTNLIFSRAGAKALCWMAEESSNFSAYSNIAKIIGVDLRYITYQAGVRTTAELYAKAYRIDVDKIRQGLAELGLQANPEVV